MSITIEVTVLLYHIFKKCGEICFSVSHQQFEQQAVHSLHLSANIECVWFGEIDGGVCEE